MNIQEILLWIYQALHLNPYIVFGLTVTATIAMAVLVVLLWKQYREE